MSDQVVHFKKEENISIISLDDGKANVFSSNMSKQISTCLDEISKEEGALIITGRQGMFSAGLDLKTIQSGNIEEIKDMSLNAFKLLAKLFSFPRPVIAACSGHGIALGTFLLCCCDYRIGVKGDFLIGANEMKTNMVIPTPILELIKFRVNQSYKYRAILGAEMFSLESAVKTGLIDEVVEINDLHERALKKAKELSTMGHPSYSLTKELLIADPMKEINKALKDLESQDV
tara:strand:+ start:12461 stop:13156 length:696 start_codon:yes stop_codon:yes gene_type:complete